MVYSWLARRLVDFLLARLRAGDIRPILALDRPDVVLSFPGTTSFSGVIRGREAHREWLARLIEMGLKNYAEEVVAVGPPWRSTVVVRGVDHADSPEGDRVYENRYVLWMHLRWGRLADYEVYEDTERATRFDAWLARGDSAAVV